MYLLDIAKEFADINIFNDHTHRTLLEKVKVFCERSGVVTLEDVNLTSITRFKKKTLEVAKPVTYNGYIRYMRLVMDYAISMGYTQHKENLFKTIRLAPVGEIPRKVMNMDVIDTACRHIAQNADEYRPHWFWLTVIYTLYYTGMRRRQLVSLRLKDIDFVSSQITLSYDGSKTHRSWVIPMHETVNARLHDLVLRSEAALGRKLKANDFLFSAGRFYPRYRMTRAGGMKAEAITGFFKRLSIKLDISIGAHRFRHTLATELCNPPGQEAPDIFAVQALLGHTSIQTTRSYTVTSKARMETLMENVRVPFSKSYA
jgi:integrase